ncbi:MAG TPA: TetR family transcriptional regulator [Rhizomicrobium sp.]
MTKTASHDKKDKTRQWQRAATRAAIVAAARRLIQRAGIDDLSLTAVAREADFAPTTVFAYFANKNDLFLCVLADDLATFARATRAPGPDSQPPANEAGVPDAPAVAPAPEAATPREIEKPSKRLRLVEKPLCAADFNAFTADPAELAAQDDIAASLRFELAADEEPSFAVSDEPPVADSVPPWHNTVARDLAQLHEDVARLESRPVDQWLERRLREFERGLSALEARPEKAEAATALASIDETMRRLDARVELMDTRQLLAADELGRSVRERSEQTERRFLELLSDVETAGARVGRRLDALENAAFAAAPEFFQANAHSLPVALPTGAVAQPLGHEAPPGKAVAEVTLAKVADPSPDTIAENITDDSADKSPDNAPASGADGSYLSAARRSALVAMEQAAKARADSPARRMSRRALAMIASGLGVVVALIWAGVFVKALAVPASQNAAAKMVSNASVQNAVAKPDVPSRLMTQARAGDTKAELVLALDLLDGPKKNAALAARWLTLAAQQGDPLAAFKLATLYRSGRGVAADSAQAFRWFDSAARKGNCRAMQNLAVAFAEGWGTEKDPAQAARWFARAAALGLIDAQFNLGVLYESGQGVPQSLPDAYKWYLVAGGAGDHDAAARVDSLKPQLTSSDLAAAEEAAASFKPAQMDRAANLAPPTVPLPAG